jgi:hypothetical protein
LGVHTIFHRCGKGKLDGKDWKESKQGNNASLRYLRRSWSLCFCAARPALNNNQYKNMDKIPSSLGTKDKKDSKQSNACTRYRWFKTIKGTREGGFECIKGTR